MKNAVLRLTTTAVLAGVLIFEQGGVGRAQYLALGVPGDKDPAWSPTGDLISFVSTRELKPEIYVMSADGSSLRRLTASPLGMRSHTPVWSPDSRRIAFVTAGAVGESQVSVMNTDGSGQKVLVSGGINASPAWAPDGRRIAFVSNRTGDHRVYIIAAEGGDPVVLAAELHLELGFSWAPDGTRLVLATEKSVAETTPGPFPFPTFKEQSEIQVVYATGRNRITIVREAAWDSDPAWSPDGKRIAFASAGAISVMNPDGSGRVQLTAHEVNSAPVWSQDARRIAFVSSRYQNPQIFVMNADGSGRVRLNRPGEGDGPSWSPDGRRIVYASKREGLWQLYVVNPDGTGETQLTQGQ